MEKINIAKLLKDCPTGMELDCTMYENTSFIGLTESVNFPIRIRINFGDAEEKSWTREMSLTSEGKLGNHPNAKCIIFPKGKTTWEGFVPPIKFKDGDVVISTSNNIHLISCHDKNYGGWESCCGIICDKFDSTKTVHVIPTRFATEEEKQKLFDAIRENGYHWNTESKTLENWTIQDAKDGDIVSYGDGWTCIFKCIHGIWYSSYCFITSDGEFHMGYEEHEVNTTINGNVHLATKEQCNLFFQKIKEAGYKWNPETKTLEKLIEPYFKIGDRIRHKNDKTRIRYIDYIYYDSYALRDGHIIYFKEQGQYELVSDKFDITTLKPFESRVLVRDNEEEKWKPAIWGYYDVDHIKGYPYEIVGGNCFSLCIPYEGNEHLLNTTDACNDYFKTWEK